MEWSKDSTLRLIEEFRRKRSLWDPTCPDYRNRISKRYHLHQLGRSFNVSDKEIENKLHNLRSQFLREYKKSERKPVSGTEDAYISKWFAYDSLLFLKDVNKQRCNLSAIEIAYEPHVEPISPNVSDVDEASTSYIESASVPSPAPASKRPRTMELAQCSSENVDDRFTVFGKFVESELRQIRGRKRLEILKKKIQDVIFETKLEEIEESERALDEEPETGRESERSLTIKDERVMYYFEESP